MSAPNVKITIEPFESGSVVYESLAPKTLGANANGQLSLMVKLRNAGTQSVHANKIVVSFIGQPLVGPTTIPIAIDIAASTTVTWFGETANNILLPVPAPSQTKVDVWCNGFSDPATVVFPLKSHLSPVVGGSYNFPAKASDLRIGEYWSGRAAAHAAGGSLQAFAYDMGVMAFDLVTHSWSDLLPGTDGTKNEHSRIWGKPIYAMAAGKVVEFANDRSNNPKPGVDLSPPDPVEGNHFYLQHGDELVLYAHFIKGSLNANLLFKGAQVKAGEFLGLAGNSGNSSGPHLHIHSIQATQPWQGPIRPLPFRNMYVIDRSALHPPDPSGPWVKVEDQGLPSVDSAIWPAASAPAWYPPGWAELARHGVPEQDYQTVFEHIASSGYRPVWVDGYDVNGRTFFNVVFRWNDGTPWVARHGLDSDNYQQEFDKWTKQGFRLAHIESYLSGGLVRYAPIFVKSPGPAWVAYHGRVGVQHQKEFDRLTDQGFRPVNISSISHAGVLIFTALYEQRNVGSFVAKSALKLSEYQGEFDQNDHAGRTLVYINAFTHNGSPHISAIWHQFGATPAIARHGLSSDVYQTEFEANLANGFLTRAVSGYEDSDLHRFAALWSK